MSDEKYYHLSTDINMLTRDQDGRFNFIGRSDEWKSVWHLIYLLFLLGLKDNAEDTYNNFEYKEYVERMGKSNVGE